jgi:hypothetical protein
MRGFAPRGGTDLRKPRLLRGLSSLAALAALSALVVGDATAKPTAKPERAVIDMVQDGKDLFFEGPKKVEKGQKLKILNSTDPRKGGPHTFSLVEKSTLPTTNAEVKNCINELEAICGAIAEWHEFDPETGEVNKQTVRAGGKGWDTLGSEESKGDSWYSETEGESFSQKVTADAGSKLYYICVVHPFMQGKLKVEG